MKFEIHFLPSNDLREYLDTLDKSKHSIFGFDTPYQSDTYHKILSASASHGNFDCFINITLSKKELDSIQSFRLVTNKNPPVSNSDYCLYQKHRESVTIKYPIDQTSYHLINKFYVSKKLINPKEHQIFGEQSFELPLITKSVKECLPQQWIKNNYISVLPVENPKTGSSREDIFILRPNLLLNDFHKDESISIDKREEDIYHRAHGMLTYAKKEIDKKIPMAFTKEKLNNAGIIIVDKSFISFIKKNKIKGLKFWPVLMKESKLYEEYIKTWLEIKKDFEINPNNGFRFFKEPAV